MNSYPLGEPVRVSVTFATSTGTATDPTSVFCKTKRPDGTITTNTYGDGSLLKDSTGAYHLDITTALAGVWSYRWIGTGALVSAVEAEFFVAVSDFGASG